MITPETTPLYYEQKIADKLGLARDALRAIRKEQLEDGKDFGQIGREIVLSATGLVALLAFLKKKGGGVADDVDFSDCMLPAPPPPGDENDQEPTPASELVEMTVIRRYPNDRLLLCADPDGRAVNVRVKKNDNFVKDMKLRARWEPQKNAYVMEGRCPRYLGQY